LTSTFIVVTINKIQIEFDPSKRTKTFAERGLDFARAGDVFAGKHLTHEDIREDYAVATVSDCGLAK
jgi:uncharacterized protein